MARATGTHAPTTATGGNGDTRGFASIRRKDKLRSRIEQILDRKR